jgi:hypothetical protein
VPPMATASSGLRATRREAVWTPGSVWGKSQRSRW